MALFGNDISNFQPSGTVAAHPDAAFFIIKATEGRTFDDPLHAKHVAQARAAKKLVGHYHFARPDNNAAKVEAEHFLAKAGARPGEVLVLDFEKEDGSDPASWPAWVIAFTATVNARTGASCWLYANNSMLTQLIARATPDQRAQLRTRPLWKAAFASKPGDLHGWPVITAWQFNADQIDKNKFFGDATTWGKLSIPTSVVA